MTARSVCVLGHVTRDIIRGPGGEETRPGGAAFYAAAALSRLGRPVRLVTRLAACDRGLLDELEGLGVAVTLRPSTETTVFETVYGADPDRRTQAALSVAAAFEASDLDGISAPAVIMDPLTAHDGFAELTAAAARTAPVVALDLQGFLRKFFIPGVTEAQVQAALKGLGDVTIVKADLDEAWTLTGEGEPARAAAAIAKLGPREVIVTMGGKGSHVLAEGRGHDIPAFAPPKLADPTGAGDTYLAGYVAARLEGASPERAARFGAAIATLKLARRGPFAGSREDVLALLAGATA